MSLGPVGRLGRWTATHVRVVALVWVLLAIGLGSMAPRVEHALSGAGWEATGSESVKARAAIDKKFAGQGSYALQVVISSPSQTVDEPAFRSALARVTRLLEANPDVSTVVAPRPGVSISSDRHTAIVVAGAACEACRDGPSRRRSQGPDPQRGRRRHPRLADGRLGDVV